MREVILSIYRTCLIVGLVFYAAFPAHGKELLALSKQKTSMDVVQSRDDWRVSFFACTNETTSAVVERLNRVVVEHARQIGEAVSVHLEIDDRTTEIRNEGVHSNDVMMAELVSRVREVVTSPEWTGPTNYSRKYVTFAASNVTPRQIAETICEVGSHGNRHVVAEDDSLLLRYGPRTLWCEVLVAPTNLARICAECLDDGEPVETCLVNDNPRIWSSYDRQRRYLYVISNAETISRLRRLFKVWENECEPVNQRGQALR